MGMGVGGGTAGTPVLMVSLKTADLLRGLMHSRQVDVAKMGLHRRTLLDDEWDEL
jgi:hypothetical protein